MALVFAQNSISGLSILSTSTYAFKYLFYFFKKVQLKFWWDFIESESFCIIQTFLAKSIFLL